ncbi:ribonuclease H-like domain-containing protein [Tanacetum coccineum]
MDVNEKLIVAIEDSNSKPWWLTDNNKILIGSTRNFDAEPMVLMILTGATKLMLHQLSHNAFNGYNTEVPYCSKWFGIESSNSMESNISSGDETLTDSAYENFKREKAYKAVPPPTGTIIPPRANVSFTGIDELAIRNKVVNQEKTKSSQSAIDRNKVIIEDWVDSDDEETDVSESQKETAFNSENSETSFENRSPNSQNSVGQESRTKGLGNKGGKLCFVCYSPNHLIKDCNLHERTFKHTQTHKPKGTQGSRETRPVWNNIQRVNHSNFSRNSRSRVPQAVLSRSTDGSYYPRMENRRPRISSYSPSSRSSTGGNPEEDLKDYAIIDSGCSGSNGPGKTRTSCLLLKSSTKVLCGIMEMTLKIENSLQTPQQNGVAERKNRTLIEAARTMLADSLLPIQFWAEAVNTACYVLNRVLVTKPQMKTPYEILMGRSPNISFMRPFGCSLTILNTLDHLGKFDGKVTRKVQDCLHVNFLENQENQKGKGPDWMFDLDLLTPSMNYIPVRKENYADSKEQGISCDDVEDLDDQQFIVHTAQPMHPEERTAAKEVPLSSEEQALHDELVSLMHQESLAKAHNDDQRIAFEEEKRRISIAKGKEHVNSTFTLSSCKYNHLKVLREIHHMILMKTPKEVFSLQTPFDAEGGGVDRLQHLDPYH